MSMTIKTDHKWRDLVYRSDVPADILEDNFGYQNAEEALDGFFQYRGHWYHLDQFMFIGGKHPLKGWDAQLTDSFYSGVVIKLSSDGEQIKTGTFFT